MHVFLLSVFAIAYFAAVSYVALLGYSDQLILERAKSDRLDVDQTGPKTDAYTIAFAAIGIPLSTYMLASRHWGDEAFMLVVAFFVISMVSFALSVGTNQSHSVRFNELHTQIDDLKQKLREANEREQKRLRP